VISRVAHLRTFFKRQKKDTGSKARDLTMRQVLSVKKTALLPSWKQWKQLPRVLSIQEKRLIFSALLTIVLCLLLATVLYVTAHRIDIPAVGGEYTEGLVGEPQFINPLYSISSDVDHDLVSLIYSGLLRWDPDEGLVPDLAESLEVNEDGTVYTLKIRDGAVFHNGDDVLARDVIFTISAIQNPSYRSPLADQFYNVSVVQEDDTTVSFILEEPFAPFAQSLTVGILPVGLWAEILPQNAPLAAINLQPIGSGPYEFTEFTKDKKGSIRSYTLTRNDDFYLEAPYIETLSFKFYPDIFALEDALSNKNVEGASIVDYEQREEVSANKNVELEEPFLPRETVLYFNQDLNDALSKLSVRQAIANAIDKTALVEKVYGSSARVIHSPILPGMLGYDPSIIDSFDAEDASSALKEAGYAGNEDQEKNLSLTLTTLDRPDLEAVAGAIREDLLAVGIELTLNLVPSDLIATQVIDPRNFELLLAPVMLEADPDPYGFWHSSQAKDAGLNLVGYESEEVDTLLERGRSTLDQAARAAIYQEFQALLAKDLPAVYLYQSTYGYALAKKIQHPAILSIVLPSDRFARITQWYIKTKKALR
jgi:peptide/nickel transport system substrate-binding protein